MTDREIAGRYVDFYLPERDVAITFDAEAYFHIQGSESISTEAVLVEYEMPGVHLGSRLPFETPELDFPPQESDAVRTAFTILGVDSDTEPEAIKAAYREKVKAAHPDHGGNQESFRRLQEAYAIATEYATAAQSSPSSF